MRINTRFPMAVHALAVIVLNKNEAMPNTSSQIAKSVGTNPVVIRRLIAQLKSAGLVKTKPGVAGTKLIKNPEEITLAEIYKAVQTDEDRQLFDVHPSPQQKCYIGRNIHSVLEAPLSSAQKALEKKLSQYTLAAVTAEIMEKEGFGLSQQD